MANFPLNFGGVTKNQPVCFERLDTGLKRSFNSKVCRWPGAHRCCTLSRVVASTDLTPVVSWKGSI